MVAGALVVTVTVPAAPLPHAGGGQDADGAWLLKCLCEGQ